MGYGAHVEINNRTKEVLFLKLIGRYCIDNTGNIDGKVIQPQEVFKTYIEACANFFDGCANEISYMFIHFISGKYGALIGKIKLEEKDLEWSEGEESANVSSVFDNSGRQGKITISIDPAEPLTTIDPRTTIFISDIHLGINTITNWYQTQVHQKALKSVLRYIVRKAEYIEDVVILGDWFDQWTYTPCDHIPSVTDIMDNNKILFTEQSDGSGDFISVIKKIHGKLRFVNGNHDMLVRLEDINCKLSELNGSDNYKVYPGTGDNLDKPPPENTSYQSNNQKVYAEHGHLYDLFNKPANMHENPYKPLPIGYFVARTACDYVSKHLSGKLNSAYLPNSGDPNYKNVGLDIKAVLKAISHKPSNVAAFALGCVLEFDDNVSEIKYNMQWDGSVTKVSSNEVGNYYSELVTVENITKAIPEAIASLEEELGSYAKKLFELKPEVEIIIMGHTHIPSFLKKEGKMYINTGAFCASIPDMEKNGKILTFVEVTSDEKRSFMVTEKIVDYQTGNITNSNLLAKL